MRDLKHAPMGVPVLVRSEVWRRGSAMGFFEPVLAGYKCAEAVLTDDGWRFLTGVDGERTTEPCSPVGWWPLPGNEGLTVDLTPIPDGWWLYGLFHNHTPIKYRGEKHVPFDKSGHGFAWTAKLQRVEGGLLTAADADTPQLAVSLASTSVLRRRKGGVA